MKARARKPPFELIHRLARPGGTVVNQISITRKLTELLGTRTERSETAALRRELEELRRKVSGLSGRPQLDAAVRRAVEEYQKKHPLPAPKPQRRTDRAEKERRQAGWVLLLGRASTAPALLHAPVSTAPALRTALRRWARPDAPARPASWWTVRTRGPELRHRRQPQEARPAREEPDGGHVLAAQRARPAPPAVVKREETVTRTEVLRLIREIPPPDLGTLAERVAERLESALRTERRRYGQG